MSRLSRDLLRVAFAFVVVLLATGVAIFSEEVLHVRNQIILGLIYLSSSLALLFLIEKTLPAVYRQKKTAREPWLLNRVAVATIAAAIYCVLASRMASLWFASVIAAGILVASFLHFTHHGGEL